MSAYTLHCGWCRWERAPTAKTITKLLSSRTGSDSDGLQSAGTMGYTLAKALGESPEYTQGSSTLHPHHICIELDDMAKQSIGTVQAVYDRCFRTASLPNSVEVDHPRSSPLRESTALRQLLDKQSCPSRNQYMNWLGTISACNLP